MKVMYHNDKNFKYEVTVIICSYNPRKDAMFFTLDSVVNQKNIRLEIIICDDGSIDNLYIDIENYFAKKHFHDWRMICNKINQGTVQNFYSGIKESMGYYIKALSPGDALKGDEVLRTWVDYNSKHELQWSFSDAIYYKESFKNMKLISAHAHPNNLRPYLARDTEQCRWNYVVLDDIAMGATMLCETEVEKKYVERILGKVKYAEDNVWRLMMFDGIVGGYYPKETVWYEYGTGISTGGNQVWIDRLEKDWKAANIIMLERNEFDDFQKIMIEGLENKRKNIFNKLLIKGKLYDYLARKFFARKTKTTL